MRAGILIGFVAAALLIWIALPPFGQPTFAEPPALTILLPLILGLVFSGLLVAILALLWRRFGQNLPEGIVVGLIIFCVTGLPIASLVGLVRLAESWAWPEQPSQWRIEAIQFRRGYHYLDLSNYQGVEFIQLGLPYQDLSAEKLRPGDSLEVRYRSGLFGWRYITDLRLLKPPGVPSEAAKPRQSAAPAR